MRQAPQLSPQQVAAYNRDGYTIVRDPLIRELKRHIIAELDVMAKAILKRHPASKERMDLLADKSLSNLFDWCIQNEQNNEITRAFYEVFQLSTAVVPLATSPFFVELSNQLGMELPLPSTLPILRIDRPFESKYQEPIHQDIWYSLLSENAITYWFPLFAISEDMGHLSIVPGSHTNGVLPIKTYTHDNWFTVRDSIPDSRFEPVVLADDEILAFSQLLVHKGGSNRSKRARLTFQIRHNDLSTLKALTSSFTAKLSTYTMQAQETLLRQSLSSETKERNAINA
jgi:hypothetical protein